MHTVEPIPNEPAATATAGSEALLIIADFHAGFEAAIRYEQGIELPDRGPERRERLVSLVESVQPDRLVVLGDLLHSIGTPKAPERAEVEALFSVIDLPVTLVKGNHDGVVEEFLEADPATFGNIEVTDARGVRADGLAFVHGHTWPAPDLLTAEVLCLGHEHPTVRLADEVGGTRIERVWMRGPGSVGPFAEHMDEAPTTAPELVVFPAFNELCGGTWVNVPDQGFLAPFLPAALPEADVYLLDGTNLGSYRSI